MLKIMLNRLKPQAEIIAKEQAAFKVGRSTTEQLFNLRILCEKHLQHQQDLYHVFIDRAWDSASRATMKEYNISANLIRVIKCLYDKFKSSSSTAAQELVPNNSWSPTGVFTLTHPLQHIHF